MTTTPCQACAVQQGTHQPAEALHQIAEPAAPVGKPIEDAIDALVMAAFTEGGCSEHRMTEARIQTELRKKELRTLLSTPCQACAVQQGTHQPAEALHQIAEPDALDIRELAAKLAFELECMLIDPHEHWDSAARALDAYKQAQGPSPSPFATDVPIPPERKAIYAALRAKREAGQAKQGEK